MTNNSRLLNALRLNAWFSAISALLLLAAAPWVAAQLGLPGPLNVYVVGVFLVVFSLQLANIVRTGTIRNWEVAAIITGDLAWVVGSVVLVALFYPAITLTGLVLVDVIAIAVLFFAIQQIRGLRELRSNLPG
jgi:hypothetical protein